jgi:spermidine/putrescine-binding protein
MKNISRRKFIKNVGATVAVAAGMPYIGNAKAATLELRWLGWEHYNVSSIVSGFEKKYGVKVSSSFFDGNSEAYNKLKAGGTNDFDLVMADGFWPRLYAKQGLIQPVDYNKISNMDKVFDDFKAPNYTLLQEEGGSNMIAAPKLLGWLWINGK